MTRRLSPGPWPAALCLILAAGACAAPSDDVDGAATKGPSAAGKADGVVLRDHASMIAFLGGDPVDALQFGDDVEGLQAYLDAVGVQGVTALDVVTPHNPDAAEGCGLENLLPEREHWEKIGMLALFVDELEAETESEIYLRNWWRPSCYNLAVGGAAGGDHPDADAIDMDFETASKRAEAQKFLCENYWRGDFDRALAMSIGLGGTSIHLGLFSERGRRFWKYASYRRLPDSGNCW